MTPQGHPRESIRAREGFTCVWYDDATSQALRLDQFELVRDATEAAKRAVRMLLPDDEAQRLPLTLTVVGLFGERHALDLLRVQQVSAWPPSSVAAQYEDAGWYQVDDTEAEPWKR